MAPMTLSLDLKYLWAWKDDLIQLMPKIYYDAEEQFDLKKISYPDVFNTGTAYPEWHYPTRQCHEFWWIDTHL